MVSSFAAVYTPVTISSCSAVNASAISTVADQFRCSNKFKRCSNTYRQLPADLGDYPYLGYFWEGRF